MFTQFPLFRSHLDLAHQYWTILVHPGDTVIDATCGNGHDTLKLAQLALHSDQGHVIGIDLQEQSLLATKARLMEHLSPDLLRRVQLICGCHSSFPEIPPKSVRLIVYNLGYLPKGDKSRTTLAKTTIESLQAAFPLLMPGGVICVTCYPGHEEGEKEEKAVLDFVRGLDPHEWCCTYQQWMNRQKAPGLLLIQRQEA